MSLSEYIVLFALVAIMGAGIPGPGDASLIAAGTLAGEGKLNVYTFVASVTMPAFVSGIFRVRFLIFVLGAFVAGVGWIGMYVVLSYLFGEDVAKRIGNAGSKALLGVLVAVALGLGVKYGVSAWRASRRQRAAA